jgi:hypothetical protein
LMEIENLKQRICHLERSSQAPKQGVYTATQPRNQASAGDGEGGGHEAQQDAGKSSARLMSHADGD